jgi:PKHD-type hydroxylase
LQGRLRCFLLTNAFGERRIKLPAGDLVLYPRHERASRRARHEGRAPSRVLLDTEDSRRTILFELDNAIQRIATDVPNHPAVVDLAGVYHNLLRTWADT